MTHSASNFASTEKSFFDIHTHGIGYIQRAREVPVKNSRNAQPFLACTIAAFVGSATNPAFRYFDVRVSGTEAQTFVKSCIGIDDPAKRPLVRFRLSDLWVDSFIRSTGDRKGEPAASLKGRLLKVELIDSGRFSQMAYHELITRGIGYLNRPREVTPATGDAFLSCTIAALCGAVDAPDYRYFDTIVTHTDAQQLVRSCSQAIEDKQRVLIAFRLNDMKAEPYLPTRGDQAGEVAATLKAQLTHIGLLKIDGKQVYPVLPASPVSAPSTPTPDATGTADSVDEGDQPASTALLTEAIDPPVQKSAPAVSF